MGETQEHRIGALLVGGAHGSLAAARSLGRRGIPVAFVSRDRQIAQYSRYTQLTEYWSGPDRPDAARDLISIAKDNGLDGWVLFPGGDAEVKMIAQQHAELAQAFRVMTPPWEIAQWALDKKLTYQRAGELGLAFPWSHYPRDRCEVVQLECRFPLILKPTTRFADNAFTLGKAWQVEDRNALVKRYDQAVALVGESGIVLQEMIPGGGEAQFSFAAVCDRGTPVASLVARRTRQYPVNIGYTSTFVEAIECKEVEEAGERFLRSLNYSGLAEVEFKYDARDKSYKILDVNTRLWTWNALGQITGVDFPHLAYQLAVGQPVAPARGTARGAWMHVYRDVAASAQLIASGRISTSDYLRSLRAPLVYAAFAADDPVPAAMDLPTMLSRLFTRRLPLMTRRWRSAVSKNLSRARF